MATNFPGALDDFANYVDGTTIIEAATLNDMQFAIEALQAKVLVNGDVPNTDDECANKKYVDDNHPTSFFNYSAAHGSNPIFSGVIGTANVYQDLNVAAITGAANVLVYLKVAANENNAQCKFRTKGDANVVSTGLLSDAGGASVVTIKANNYIGYAVAITDSDGKLEWTSTDASATWTIDVIGFVI